MVEEEEKEEGEDSDEDEESEESESEESEGEEIDYGAELQLKKRQLCALLSCRDDGLEVGDEKARLPAMPTVLPSCNRAAPKPCSPQGPAALTLTLRSCSPNTNPCCCA